MRAAAAPSGCRLRHAPRGHDPGVTPFRLRVSACLPMGARRVSSGQTFDPETYFRFSYPGRVRVNEIAMVFFFGLMTKEIVEATAPGGLFHPWRRLILPIVASVGGVLSAAMLDRLLIGVLERHGSTADGRCLFATDLGLRLLHRPRHIRQTSRGDVPAADGDRVERSGIRRAGGDALRSGKCSRPPAALLMMLALASAGAFRLAGIRSFWPYVVVAGTLVLAGALGAGFHPAFALVPILPFLPHARRDPGFFVDAPAERGTRSTASSSGAGCRRRSRSCFRSREHGCAVAARSNAALGTADRRCWPESRSACSRSRLRRSWRAAPARPRSAGGNCW